jgi:hypothetical protein
MAAIACAVLAIVAAALIGAEALALLWALAVLLGVLGFVASIVGLAAAQARRDAAVGLATSFIAVLGPVLIVIWILRNVEWGW